MKMVNFALAIMPISSFHLPERGRSFDTVQYRLLADNRTPWPYHIHFHFQPNKSLDISEIKYLLGAMLRTLSHLARVLILTRREESATEIMLAGKLSGQFAFVEDLRLNCGHAKKHQQAEQDAIALHVDLIRAVSIRCRRVASIRSARSKLSRTALAGRSFRTKNQTRR